MIMEKYNVLLITKQPEQNRQIQKILSQSEVWVWELDWVNKFSTALIISNYKKYSACIVECPLDQVVPWVDYFDSIPVIWLGENTRDGIKALELGVTDYWLISQLNCGLIENSLRLAINDSKTKNLLKEYQDYYETLHQQYIEQQYNQTTILSNIIFENIPNGVLIVDDQGIICFANHTATVIFQQPLPQLIGFNFGIPLVSNNSTELQILRKNNSLATVEIYAGNTWWNDRKAYILIMTDITQKKETELLLRDREEKFHLITDNIQEIFFIYSGDNQTAEYVSPAYERIFEESREVVYQDSQSWLKKVHPEDLKRLLAKSDELMKTNDSSYQEYRIIRNNGEIRWIALNTFFVKSQSGIVDKIVGLAEDITERKTFENQLRENHLKLQVITDNLPACVAYVDHNEIYQFVNQNYAQLVKKSPDDIIGKTIYEVVGDSIYQFIRPYIAQVFLGERVEYEHDLIDLDFQYQYVKVQYLPQIEDGKVIGFFAFLINLTKEKRIEQALKASENRYRSLYEKTPGILHSLDPQGKIINVSNKWLETFGYTREEVVGQYAVNFLTPESQKYALEEIIPQFNQQGYIHNISYQFVTKSGEILDILLSAVLEKDLEGNDLFSLALLEDVTARKKLEKQVQEYQENLENLVAQRTQSLWESETKNRALLNAIPDLMFRINKEGYFIDFHAQNEAELYLPSAEFLGKKFTDLMPPELTEKALKAHQDALRNGSVESFEYQLVIDGEIHYYENRVVANGENEVLAIIRDITREKIALQEREKAQAELQQSEALYRILFSSIADAIFLTDEGGNFTFICDNVHHIFGYDPSEFNGIKSLDQLIGVNKIIFDQETATKDIINLETDVKDKWQNIHSVLINLKTVDLPQGKYLITVHDITEKKQAQIALQESETRFRELVEHIEESFWVNPPDPTKVIYISPGYEKIWGRTPQSLLDNGAPWVESVHPDDRPRQIEALQEMAEGKGFSEEYRIIRPDGEIRWVFARAYQIHDENGNLLRHVGIAEDITDRKKAEERHLIAQKIAKLGNWEWNIQTNEIYWSEEIYHIFGVDKKSFQSNYNNFLNCIHPEDRELVINAVNYTLEHQTSYSVDHRIVLPNGEIKIVHEQGDLITNGEKQPLYMVGTVQDITDRKKVEQALRDSENRLEEAQKVAHIGSWEYDLQTGKIEWSKELYHLYELNPSQPPPTFERQLKRVHPGDRLKTQSLLEKLVSQGVPYQFDYRIILPNGTIRYAEARGKPIFDESGNLIKVFGTSLDITQRKQTEFALKESEERFRVVFEQAGIGMSICNLAGQFLQVNQTLSEIVGYSTAELLERSIHDLTAFKYRLVQKNKLRQLILGRQNSFSLEKYYICKDGAICWVNAIISLVTDSHNQPKSLIYIVEDITDRKKAKIQLEQAKEKAEAANRAKSQFLANMSHELRTPLNAVLGFTQLMSRASNLTQTHQQYLDIINRSGEHLLSLINDILDLSKIEAGQLKTTKEAFNLSSLLDDLEKMFSLKASLKDLELNFSKDPAVPTYIKSDQKKLKSVLINLIGNAIKFTNAGSVSITINSEELDHPNYLTELRLIFSIEDTGIGIDPREIESLFDVFVQSQFGKKQAEGTGLGLAISKHFVEMMGGQITVRSTMGKGSTFYFDIICELACAQDLESNGPGTQVIGLQLAPGQRAPSILIVEDQWTNCELLLNILEPLGFELQTADNGEKALEIWQTWHPDLILMDIRLPILDGYEVTKTIRRQQELSQDKSAVILALTASVFDSQKELLLAAGCDDFIPKPFDENQLLEKIRFYLHLNYFYQEIPPSVPLQNDPTNHQKYTISSADLQIMSLEWRQELHKLALSARSKQISFLLEQIPLEYGYIKHSLMDLLSHLNYEKIVELAQTASS